MIASMRRYRRALQVGLLVVVAAFVVSSVVVFGSGQGERAERDRETVVATVNGEAIPVERFERRYRAYYDSYARQYQDRFSPEVAEILGLSSQVVADLVQEALVVQRARAEGLELTDEELNTSVHAVPSFQDNGRFSLKRYEEVLRDRGFTKASFENDVRRELTRSKVENTVKQGVKVTDAEVEQAYVSDREEVRAVWALLDLGALADAAAVTDEELQKYLEGHGEEFRQPLRRKVQMASLPLRDFNVPVPQEEIEKYYAEHGKDFETPHQVKASHILFRVDAAKGKEGEDAARAKAADALKRLKAGQDFAKLARELSEDPASAKNGGDLGWVSRGEMVAPFESAIFGMKKGDTSTEPVQTTFGFHVIRVMDVREATKPPLAAVTPQIRERLAGAAAEKAAKVKADEIRTALLNAKDFMAEARAKGLAPPP
jgi:peptidyl-prolyl cis-trans isomerase D